MLRWLLLPIATCFCMAVAVAPNTRTSDVKSEDDSLPVKKLPFADHSHYVVCSEELCMAVNPGEVFDTPCRTLGESEHAGSTTSSPFAVLSSRMHASRDMRQCACDNVQATMGMQGACNEAPAMA